MTFPYKGYAGHYLEVDLTKGEIHKKEMEKEWARLYLGGSGVSSKILWERTTAETDPLSPDNVVVVGTGPLTGSMFSPSGRMMFAARGPLTGVWAESHVGGFMGPEIKYAGFDFVIITGRSNKPVYLFLRDGKAELLDASHLWGQETDTTTKMIREDHKDPSIETAVIGPAGENQVLYSGIIVDFYRAAGRAGLGAVLGSKNMKGIAASGSLGLEAYDMEKYLEANAQEMEKLKDPLWKDSLASLRKYGTTDLVAIINEIGRLPTKNHWTGFYEDADDIGPEIIAEKYRIAQEACHGCAVGCKYVIRVKGGKYPTEPVGGPEYETLMAFGSNCLNNDIESIFHMGKRCDLLGLDTISCGKTISFAMELYEKGIWTKDDTDGLDLTWGNAEAQVELVEKIAKREGVGKILSNGVRKAAEQIGGDAWKYAVHVKGLEASGQDPRAHQSIGLTYATNVRGADHLRSLVVVDQLGYEDVAAKRWGEDKLPEIIDPYTEKYKANAVFESENAYCIRDTLIVCWYTVSWPPIFWMEDFAKILPLATGENYFSKVENLTEIAERQVTLKRLFNAREGITKKDDSLPDRFTKDPMPEGPGKGQTVDLEPMLRDYYTLRGWDLETGLPTDKTLKRLSLEWTKAHS